jgi:1-phosphofructokinase
MEVEGPTVALATAMLAAGLEADISVLTGCDNRAMMDDARFHNLAHALHAVGGRVVGDLSGGPLVEALKGGLDLVKLSAEGTRGDGPLAVPRAPGRARRAAGAPRLRRGCRAGLSR